MSAPEPDREITRKPKQERSWVDQQMDDPEVREAYMQEATRNFAKAAALDAILALVKDRERLGALLEQADAVSVAQHGFGRGNFTAMADVLAAEVERLAAGKEPPRGQ